MKEKLQDLQDIKCPLCHRTLASYEYKKALSELEATIVQRYEKADKKRTEGFAQQLKRIKKQHRQKEKSLQASHDNEMRKLQKSLEGSHDRQLDALEKSYDKLAAQSQKQFSSMERKIKLDFEKRMRERDRESKAYERETKAAHRKELAHMARQIQQLKKERASVKKEAREGARTDFQAKYDRLNSEMAEKEIQIRRFTKEVDGLKRKITQAKPGPAGGAGELDLYATLTHAFANDFFRRQKKGTSSGDLIQQIRTPTGSLDTLIVYDNRAAATVTKKDVEKAKKYKKIHGTNYVIIVSSSLPKRSVPNGIFGEMDGVLLVHHSIITEVARHIRTGIIEISKLSKSKEDQEAKQSRLYEYIISGEFSMMLESLYAISGQLASIQTREEKDHETLWKTRKSLYGQLVKAANDLSSGIESITQKEITVEGR